MVYLKWQHLKYPNKLLFVLRQFIMFNITHTFQKFTRKKKYLFPVVQIKTMCCICKDTFVIKRSRMCANLSQSATDLIIRLCCGPEARLGIKGADEIKKHPFFHGINFNGLRRQKSPYKPKITHATDTSNFDPIDPERIRGSDSDEEIKKPDHPENGKHPEHAFFEFTFRRFFDDGGHPYPSIKNPDELSEPEKEAESNSPVYV